MMIVLEKTPDFQTSGSTNVGLVQTSKYYKFIRVENPHFSVKFRNFYFHKVFTQIPEMEEDYYLATVLYQYDI